MNMLDASNDGADDAKGIFSKFSENCKLHCLLAFSLLGRLPKVDLIILEGGKCLSVRPSVRLYVRTSVHPQKVSSISMKFGI